MYACGKQQIEESVMAPENRAEDRDLDDSGLVSRLELTFRMLGKRVYAPSLRRLRTAHQGIDKGSFPVLGALEEFDNARPSDLAAVVELDLSTVSRHLSHFERLGLITRTPDAGDRRACRISLTPIGRESLASIRAARNKMLDDVFDDWPKAQRLQLLHLLDRLVTDIGNLGAQPSPASHDLITEKSA
jgi:DNA-binding MarR family transcriptional regulator